MRVREVMSSPAVVVAPETSVKQAAAVLDQRGFTCLPVVDGDGKPAGAVSEADLLMDRFPPDPRIPIIERPEREVRATVADVMSRDVLTAGPDEDVSVALAALHAAGHRSVPVIEATRANPGPPPRRDAQLGRPAVGTGVQGSDRQGSCAAATTSAQPATWSAKRGG